MVVEHCNAQLEKLLEVKRMDTSRPTTERVTAAKVQRVGMLDTGKIVLST